MSWQERCSWYEAVHRISSTVTSHVLAYSTLPSHAQGEEAVAAAAAWKAKREAEAAKLAAVWANASDKVVFVVGVLEVKSVKIDSRCGQMYKMTLH